MKSKIISLLLLFFIKFLFINNCFSQIGNVDTSHILLESPVYDIRNPQFDKTGTSLNYSIKDCLLAYEKWSSGMNSLIAVRFMKYNSLSPEILLTDDSSLNIKPSVAYFIEQSTQPENNPGAIVFQTNRNGNWDIYFSSYNMVSWSVPVPISGDTADEIEPCISPYKINNALNFMVTYKKGNDIYLKNFFNGVWMNEFNITMNDTSDCFSPVISKSPIGSNGEFFVAYNRRINSNSNQITYQRLIVNSDGSLNFLFTNNIAQPNTQNNIRFSNGVNFCFLNYDYLNNGRKNFYSVLLQYNNYSVFDQSSGYTGDNFGGTGSSHGDITNDFPNGYTLTTWIRKINDSTQIIIEMNNFNNYRSKFYVGDSTAVTFVNSSSKLVFGAPYTTYRIRVLWEKMINGKMAIVESFRDSYLTSVSTINSGIPENFSLSQNYPNPFNPSTNLEFGISKWEFVSLKVFDIQGKEVATLVNEKLNPGTYKIEFDGKGLPSGVYFYKLETAGFADTKRMILLK